MTVAKTKDLPSKADNKAQSRAFIEKAREVGADEERSAADDVLNVLAHKRPEPRKKPNGGKR